MMPDLRFMVENHTGSIMQPIGRELRREDLRWLMFHRISLRGYHRGLPGVNTVVAPEAPIPDDMLDVQLLANAMRDPYFATGGRLAYHFLVLRDGRVQQGIALWHRGAHGIVANSCSWAIATVGDFRTEPLTQPQEDSLARLAALLLPCNGGLRGVGHGDVREAYGDHVDKSPGGIDACPGKFLNVEHICFRAYARLPPDWSTWGEDRINGLMEAAGISIR